MKYTFKIELTGQVEVGSITDADVIRVLADYSNRMELINDDASFQHADKNRALLKAARDNPGALLLLAKGAAIFEASQALEELHHDFDAQNSEEEIVKRLIPQLEPEPASLFTWAIENSLFSEKHDTLFGCISGICR